MHADASGPSKHGPCPTLRDWLSLFEEGGPPESLLRHAREECSDCEQNLALAQEVSASLPMALEGSLSPEQTRAALDVPNLARKRAELHPTSFGERIRARDTAKVRSLGIVRSRSHLFDAGSYEIDIAWLESGALAGQILPKPGAHDLEDASCMLYGTDGQPQECAVRPSGEFHFPVVDAGPYVLIVESGETRLVLSDLRRELDD